MSGGWLKKALDEANKNVQDLPSWLIEADVRFRATESGPTKRKPVSHESDGKKKESHSNE